MRRSVCRAWVSVLLCTACGGSTSTESDPCHGIDLGALDAAVTGSGGGAGASCAASIASAKGSYPGGKFSAGFAVFGESGSPCNSLTIVMISESTLPGPISGSWPKPWLMLSLDNRAHACIPVTARLFDGVSQYDASGAAILKQATPTPVGAFKINDQGFDLGGEFAPAHCSDLDTLCH